jgi:hypothetical protein
MKHEQLNKLFPQHFHLHTHHAKQMEQLNNFYSLHIFDFDGTLFNTPEPEMGQIEYQMKTGRKFPSGYWWNKKESLDLRVFDISAGPAYNDFWKSVSKIETDNVCTMIMTGRSFSLCSNVLKILHVHKMEPILSVFRPIGFKGSTIEYKQNTLKELVSLFPNVREISMWDDRLDHVKIYRNLRIRNFNLGVLVQMSVHHVVSNGNRLFKSFKPSQKPIRSKVSISNNRPIFKKRALETTREENEPKNKIRKIEDD